jgi:hypothetical protein
MDSNDYKIDKLQILQDAQAHSLEKFELIEKNCTQNSVSFLKSNFSNVKIRNRKTEPNVNILLAICWGKICGLAGIKTEVDQFVIEDITKMIFYAYSDLTIEEIYKAFELERYGVYENKTEHFQLFNSDYISTILKKYRVWKNNTKIHHNINEEKKSTSEISDEEKEKIIVAGVNRVFEEFRETKNIDGPTEYLFDFLVEKGKIKTKGTEALVIYYQTKLEEAKLQLKKETEKTEAKSPAEKKQFKIDLERIISGQSGKILIRAKRNILFEYFNKQIQLDQQTIF